MKKFFVLGVLFALPIVAYLFFSSGVNHFAKLPVLSKNIEDINRLETLSGKNISFEDNITVLAFFGDELQETKGNTFNLDQKILEKYYEFDDFQFVILLPQEARPQAENFVREFSGISNTEKWKFVFAPTDKIQSVFESLNSPYTLDAGSYSPYVFIIDKEGNLRGRDADEDYGELYGYDSASVAELSNKMNDDVKVILAEYRLELKKYKADR